MPAMAGGREHSAIWDQRRLEDPHGQADKAARVRAMFDAIAPTYELVNHVTSAGLDGQWRRQAALMARTCSADRVLDVACGTGDFARAFAEASPRLVVGCDFSGKMLNLAAGRNGAASSWCGADALSLPFADGSFSLVGCAFGVRNFQDLSAGLGEMCRVLNAGGRAVILEFSMPRRRLLGRLYRFYLHRVLPRVAAAISRDRCGAYRYLPKSVSSFIDAADMIAALRSAGFSRVEHREQSVGIVSVFIAWKD